MLAVVPSRTDPTRPILSQAFKHAFLQFDAVDAFVRGLTRRDGDAVAALSAAVFAFGGVVLLTGGVPLPALLIGAIAASLLVALSALVLAEDGRLSRLAAAALRPPRVGAARYAWAAERGRSAPPAAEAIPEPAAARSAAMRGARRIVAERAAMRSAAADPLKAVPIPSAPVAFRAVKGLHRGARTIAPATAAS